MNNKLEALREEYKHMWGYESDIRQDYGFTLKEIADFFLSRFATIMDEVVESIVPEEKEINYHGGTDIGKVLTDGSEAFGFNSAISTIKNNYKEIKQ